MKKHRVLFIKPGERTKNHIWAIHHFAVELSRTERFRIYFATSNFNLFENTDITTFSIYPPLEKRPAVILSYIKRLLALANSIKRIHPHIVYVNNHIGAFSSLLITRIFGKKTYIVLDIRTLPDKKWKYLYYKFCTPFFDRVLALNNEIIEKMVNNEANSLLPLGYDPAIFFQDTCRPVFEGKTTLKCVYYGSLDRKRKLIRLVSGVGKAVNAGCDIKLTVIGTGNGREALINFVNEAGINHIVTFHEFVNQDKLREIMLEHDLGISFVPDEGFYKPQVPLKTVEMLACGLPVLVTDTEGNREVVRNGENGYIKGDSAEDIFSALQKIWEDGISEDIYKRTSKSVEHLTWSKIVKTYLFPAFEKILKYQ